MRCHQIARYRRLLLLAFQAAAQRRSVRRHQGQARDPVARLGVQHRHGLAHVLAQHAHEQRGEALDPLGLLRHAREVLAFRENRRSAPRASSRDTPSSSSLGVRQRTAT